MDCSETRAVAPRVPSTGVNSKGLTSVSSRSRIAVLPTLVREVKRDFRDAARVPPLPRRNARHSVKIHVENLDDKLIRHDAVPGRGKLIAGKMSALIR
ncbi:hypothetical protein ALC57_03379 [Trachymyrmex cornetzi]|uniref:Uncharacterized protein n=1 Tax=Trachymyrmex cornetzi TaxID=471704 RepID=A0A195EGL1_9HYME|nr:hypothetical protein ALC57_03379 [Trachymyrmex cornetzi]